MAVSLSFIRHKTTDFTKKKLVILGTGWGGFRLLRDIDLNYYNVNVISPRNHFLFTPLLTSTTVGTLEFRGIIEPVRTARSQLNYVQAYCTGIDTENKQVYGESFYSQPDPVTGEPVKSKFQMRYDVLVVAVGAEPNTFGVEGVREHCHFLKQISDARDIRQKILECFERASDPTISPEERKRLLRFVIVGGGPTSVEFAAELHDFLKKDVHKWFPDLEDDVMISLVEAGKKLLSSFDEKLSDYTMRLYTKRKIDVRTGVAVARVTESSIFLSDGAQLDYGLCVWSTGVAATSLVKKLAFEKDPSGRISVDACLRVEGQQDIYAIGDCAVFPGSPLPFTAQVAEQEGKYLAKRLNQLPRGVDVPSFHFNNRGMLAYIGGHQALVDTPFSKSSGFLSWIVWNAAYITKLVSIRNKIMIPLYWFKSFLFGRDIARF